MKIAAIQMASGSNIEGNLIQSEKYIAAAVDQGAEIVLLPENFAMIGAHQKDVVAFREEPGNGQIQDFLAKQSEQHQIILVGGSVPITTDNDTHFRNSMLVYNETGSCISRYDKIHIFDVNLPETNESFLESEVIQAGNQVVVVDTGKVKLGLAICYDLRFPELFRLLIEKGAEVILLPAAFTAATGKAHWHALLKARAIENLTYIIASAQGGYHVNGKETYGHSLILDSWGNILDEKVSGFGFCIADIDLQKQQKIRHTFPALSHRKIFENENI